MVGDMLCLRPSLPSWRCSGMPQVVSLKCLWREEVCVCGTVFSNCCTWAQRVFLQWGSRGCVEQAAGGAAGCDALPLLRLLWLWLGGSGCVCLHPSLPSSQPHEAVGSIAITPCRIEVNSSFVTDSSNLIFG